MSNKEKRKAHRKSLRQSEIISGLKKKKAIEKWIKEWQESRPDYPTTQQGVKLRKLSWRKEFRKLFRKQKPKQPNS